jgi:DNA (cytosine-5)-methyltransferase 1
VDNTITTLEFCAGYGGIGLGLKNIFGERLRCLAYCELEGFAQANLISKMEKGLLDVAPLWSDLKTFPYGKFHGLVDILIAGYPCQPFSAAGKRAGKEDPRHLWPWIADGIRILRPRACFFENVEGHISLGLSSVISDLEELGYKVSWGIFSAREVGAPHQRKRVFILAHSECAGLEGWIGGLQPEGDRRGPSGDIGESGNLLVNAGNNGGSNVSRIECSQKKQPLFGFASGDVADTNDGGSWEDKQSSQLWTNGIEQPSRNCGHSNQTANEQVWPSRPGEPQHGWEPPRVVAHSKLLGRRGRSDGDAGGLCGEIQTAGSCGGGTGVLGNAESEQSSSRDHRGQQGSLGEQEQVQLRGRDCGALRESNWQTQPPLGGNPDGTSDWMDYAELYTTCDNRTDELRLLGNGVVPATAERAFRILLTELLITKQP